MFRCVPFVIALFVGLAAARADEITDEIDRARKLYGEGKVTEAKQSLDMASQLISQRKARLLGDVLPQPLTGWTSSEPDGAAPGTSLLGTGIAASRIYTRERESCLISVVGDSPAMAMVNLVFSNPSMAAAAGAKVQRIAGQRALFTSDGNLQIMSTNNYLVTVSGSCREADKIAYASGIDFQKLERF